MSIPPSTTAQTAALDPATFDRTNFSPPHEGNSVLPHDLLFHRLHFLASTIKTPAVRAPHIGLEKSYQALLLDVVKVRNYLSQTLSKECVDSIQRGAEISILLAATGYEFVVSFLAILCLGAVAVPLSPHVTPAELTHFAKTSRARAALCATDCIEVCRSVTHGSGISTDYQCTLIEDALRGRGEEFQSLIFSSSLIPNPNKPGVIIFTSGSTGPPKGAVMRRGNITLIGLGRTWVQRLDNGETILQTLPLHHVTGLFVNVIPFLCGGGCVEFTTTKFQPRLVWDRIRQRGIATLSAVPTIFIKLIQCYDNELSQLPSAEQEEYRQALNAIQFFHCGSAALPQHWAERWAKLVDGRYITERYGGTEFGNPFLHIPGASYTPGSVGVKNPNCESYLENGTEGEVCVRSPTMFSKYVYDVAATRKSLTDDGFFKTGDVAEEVNGLYYIKGRSSIDIIKSGGYKISALDIEREMVTHPDIAECAVVPLDDPVMGQRIAVAVVLHDSSKHLSLAQIREYLQPRLSYYKLPTVLRVVPELEKTTSFKVRKVQVRQTYFSQPSPEIQTQKEQQQRAKL